jgi:uncharacterized protein DUF4340
MKKNLIFLVLLAIIGTYFFWDRDHTKQKEERKDKQNQLFTIEKDQVEEIDVVKGNESFKAVKEGDRWKLTLPFETDADKASWDNIARSFTSGKRKRVIVESATDVARFGLDNPKMQVSLAGINGATKTTLLFGNTTPTSGKYFTMVQGASDVMTVSSNMYTTADKKLFDFRDKTIVDMETDQVQKIDVLHTSANFSLERKAGDQWIVSHPVLARADQGKINEMINAIKNGKIKQFIDEKPESLNAYGLIYPATKLVFWTGSDSNQSSWASHKLIIGGTTATENWYAKRGGQDNVFAVAPTDFNNVPVSLDDLRLKKINSLKNWEIDYIKLTSSGSVLVEATKSVSDWTLLQPQQGKSTFTQTSNLIREAAGLEAASFVHGTTQEYGMDKVDLEIVLEKTDEAKQDVIRLTKGDDGNYYGARTEPLEIYSISAQSITALLDKVSQVKLEEQLATDPLEEDANTDANLQEQK